MKAVIRNPVPFTVRATGGTPLGVFETREDAIGSAAGYANTLDTIVQVVRIYTDEEIVYDWLSPDRP